MVLGFALFLYFGFSRENFNERTRPKINTLLSWHVFYITNFFALHVGVRGGRLSEFSAFCMVFTIQKLAKHGKYAVRSLWRSVI